ncbi:MAG: dual specificity protein phosphatase family protein [Deltaproteobacteria bacterium]|nr:dual specificity protein phosphatase family protein [Deltaproteobacteria bacterium]
MRAETYELCWLTEQLALGNAPCSYEDLESIQRQGISAIVNLCAEYCDLHDIESSQGFAVYYLPVIDEGVPSLEELDKALDWVEEVISGGNKVLVHCRLGLGRTATFVTAYLLRKGFGLRTARRKIEQVRGVSCSYCQWKLLRKYRKKCQKCLKEKSSEV